MIETVKQFPELSGIYKITSPTGRIYIGEKFKEKMYILH
jgi:hypothetical protein